MVGAVRDWGAPTNCEARSRIMGRMPQDPSIHIQRYSNEGATAVEYALMVALIALVIVGAVIAIGAATSDAMCGPVPTLGGTADDC
jgi:hypothetical protein